MEIRAAGLLPSLLCCRAFWESPKPESEGLIMTNEKFQREKTYQITLHIVRKIIQDGILTEDEMRMIDTI
jgi:hypothetical protein